MKKIIIPQLFLLFCYFVSSSKSNETGTYTDSFTTTGGCDSIRTLNLTVNVCQPECGNIIGSIFGTPEGDIRGFSLAATPENDGFYLAGSKEDSVLILKMKLSGEIEWARTFDIVPDEDDNVNSIIVDSDGMLALSGTAGDINVDGASTFAFRYDPTNNQVLWAVRYFSTRRNYNFIIIQKDTGGNYILSNNHFQIDQSNNDSEIFEINKNTGIIIPAFSKHYDLGGSDGITDLVWHGNFIYGVGRYTDGVLAADMRNTLVKLNETDGTVVWAKMGHVPANQTARLYGSDLVIDQDEIYSTYHGDPGGTNTTNTKLFLQKTSLTGDLIWLKQYELPGANDEGNEIIKSGNGIVVLASTRTPPGGLIMFKIDADGNVLWSYGYQFSSIINSIPSADSDFGATQLIEVGNKLVFTAHGINTTGGRNLILVRTDLEGKINNPCVTIQPVSISVQTISNPTFYSVNPDVFTYNPDVTQLSSEGIKTKVDPREECIFSDTLFSSIEVSICEGESYQGYTESGIYSDTLITADGCDSIRTLNLTVNLCQSECGNMIGSIFGSPEGDIRGFSLAATPENDGFYLAGSKEDSVLILKMKLSGEIEWARTFDIVPDEDDNVNSIIVDSDGMLALSGTAGDINIDGASTFAFRYDPTNNQVLWAVRYFSTLRNYNFIIIQKDTGGNYILSNNHFQIDQSNNDSEIFEINKNTGIIIPAFSKHYDLGGSDGITDLVWHGNFIYGVGRYTDGVLAADMRNTLVKLNETDGTVVWAKMGHVPANQTARLYGSDLVIDQDEIYSTYHGDPGGTNTTNTKLFLQKTSLTGDLIWLKQYELPGANDEGNEIIKSGNGYVVLASTRTPPGGLIMFKIDADGNVLWSYGYQFSSIINSIPSADSDFGATQLIEVGNKLVFTAHGINTTGGRNLILVRTDLEGKSNIPCVISQAVSIPVQTISNPTFYSVNPNVFTYDPDVTQLSSEGIKTKVDPREECIFSDTLFSSIEVSICEGESYQGHTESGIYSDTLITADGCDSISTLYLNVISCLPIVKYDLDACTAFTTDGTNMDYTEFIPTYPTPLSCADVTANYLFRSPPQMNKHSCTPGINGSVAMCVSALNSCTYSAGDQASVVIEISINPPIDSIVKLTGLEFYQKAPSTYSWISGPSGPNNYPTLYGIRIFKNGTEIFRETDIQTTLNWTLQSYDFIDNDLFLVEENTIFRIELLPYCPIGNASTVSAWDLDDIFVFGGCVPVPENNPMIYGNVLTKAGQFIPDVMVQLADNSIFSEALSTITDETGSYLFDHLEKGRPYFLQGYKNDDVLNGVNTLDLIQIQKHLLGIKPFTSLHQYIAADINRSGRLNVIDLLDLRKTLLGINHEFPGNTSWRFGMLPQNMDGTDLSAFQEIKNLEYLERDTQEVNFIGIKIGDINGDIPLIGMQEKNDKWNVKELTLLVEDKMIHENTPFSIDVRIDQNSNIAGIQMAFSLEGLNVISVDGAKIPVTAENFSFTENGIFRFSWNQPGSVNVSDNDLLFRITLISNRPGVLKDIMKMEKSLMIPQLYSDGEPEVNSLKLKIVNPIFLDSEIGYFQIEPNPVRAFADVHFYLAHGGRAILRFYDVSGRLLLSLDKVYMQGENKERISNVDFQFQEGVIYCQLVSNGFAKTEKLVIVN